MKKITNFVASLLVLLVPAFVQAQRLQAEDYTWFYDTTPGNTGGSYRSDDVDIQPTSDGGPGFNVGWIDANEWLAFQNIHFRNGFMVSILLVPLPIVLS